jgi:hypothetical protein
MSATMMNMELVYADLLQADQLMEGDIIRHNDEFVTVNKIDATNIGWLVSVANDFGEDAEIEFDDEAMIRLYVYIE